ncbi:hypothetical protein SPF06_07160 [Sinomonas sp. JGH33]|uniref:Uncharacterized protein n=1 Tax=Sinomonas terricola TaxID=3110330 RepID=A0ABU5T4T0_9MICC|nr:hypothetical protein [Sinomonas sp. JGH33]MEA5454496.1 hypothetical protein [Sinomonas sp. JGH33]
MSAAGLVYAAMYEVADVDTGTADLFVEAELRWVDDVVGLGCRPTGESEPIVMVAEVGNSLWVEVTAPVKRIAGSTKPDGELHETAGPSWLKVVA